MYSRASIIWQPSAFGADRPKARLKTWLASSDSLTARIRAACRGRLGVQVLSERWERPRDDESAMLGVWQQLAWVREIFLVCDGEPWVFARTVMPLASLGGRYRRLRHLGTKPLGSVLFPSPAVRRRRLEIGRVGDPAAFDLEPVLDYQEPLWARRSLLELGTARRALLVTELFLPALDHGRAYGRGA